MADVAEAAGDAVADILAAYSRRHAQYTNTRARDELLFSFLDLLELSEPAEGASTASARTTEEPEAYLDILPAEASPTLTPLRPKRSTNSSSSSSRRAAAQRTSDPATPEADLDADFTEGTARSSPLQRELSRGSLSSADSRLRSFTVTPAADLFLCDPTGLPLDDVLLCWHLVYREDTDRVAAALELASAQDGTFLLRSSSHHHSSKALCVHFGGLVLHFLIEQYAGCAPAHRRVALSQARTSHRAGMAPAGSRAWLVGTASSVVFAWQANAASSTP
jgi:hypothetical protein